MIETNPEESSALPDEHTSSELISADPASSEDSDVLHFHFNATKTQTRRIDQFLVDRVTWLSRNIVQRLIDEELVKVNGKPVKPSYKIKAGDVVEMVAPPEPVNDLLPEPIPLEIVYEDEHFLALNKQADLIVHPARGKWSGTLVNGLVHYGTKWSSVGGNWRPGILHRLDRNTTGIMLVAKSDEAHWRLARQFENRSIQKTYLAVAHGVPPLLADEINLPIGKDKYHREKQAVRKEENGGRQAITWYQVLEKFGPAGNSGISTAVEDGQGKGHPRGSKYTLLRLMPKTGRTHQLRVHMSAIGFPLVGDTVYGGQTIETSHLKFERQALHAYEISFTHPGTLKSMTLRAPLPADMRALIHELGGKWTDEFNP